MKFIFKAKNKEGEIKEGMVEASNSDLAVEILQKNNLFPISVRSEKGDNSFSKSILKSFDQVTKKELMVFFRQLAILIEAKVPIVSSLISIMDQTENRYFQKVLSEIVGDIQDGTPFSTALTKHRNVFSSLSINIIKTGEVSGNLVKSVQYVANNIEKNYKLTSKVRSALIYPLVVLLVFFVIAFLVVTIIVPRLTTIIKDLGVTPPWYTQVVISTGDFMAAYWWAVLIIIFGFVGGIIYYVKTDDGKREWDQIKIKLPVFGPLFRYLYISRFADNLSVLLAGGIPIIRALQVVSAVIGNSVYEAIILRAAEEVKVGGTMSSVFRKYPQFPPIVAQMIKIGEESGQVDEVLKRVADFYEQEVDEIAKNLSVLLEPILMIIIGIFVAFLAFSVIMPIYNIAGQM